MPDPFVVRWGRCQPVWEAGLSAGTFSLCAKCPFSWRFRSAPEHVQCDCQNALYVPCCHRCQICFTQIYMGLPRWRFHVYHAETCSVLHKGQQTPRNLLQDYGTLEDCTAYDVVPALRKNAADSTCWHLHIAFVMVTTNIWKYLVKCSLHSSAFFGDQFQHVENLVTIDWNILFKCFLGYAQFVGLMTFFQVLDLK